MITKRATLILIVSVLCLFASPAFAQVGIEGGSGLFFVDKAKTLGHKSVALGAFYTDSAFNQARQGTDQSTLSGSLTLGWGESFEVSVQIPTTNVDLDAGGSADGLTDGIGKVKWNFLNLSKYNIRVAAIGLVTLPWGDENKGLGTGDTDVGAMLAIDKEYENITWHFNIGYLDYSAKQLDPATLYGAGLEWFPMDKLSVIGEVSGSAWSDQIPWRDDMTQITAGVRYYPGDWGSVSLAYNTKGGGSGEDAPVKMFMAGVTVGLGLGKRAATAPKAEAPVPAPTPPAPKAPEAVPAPVAAPLVIKVVLESVHFRFDSAELTGEAKEILAKNAEKLNDNPGVRVVIEGHTCSIGSKGYNYKLGLRRAKAAKLFLAKEVNVEPDRMFVITSFGEERPVQPNTTREGRRLNRRVDFVIQIQ